MRSRFEIQDINWLAVLLISAFVFIFGFTFFDKWIALLLAGISVVGVAFVTGRFRDGRVTKIVDVTPQKDKDIVVRR